MYGHPIWNSQGELLCYRRVVILNLSSPRPQYNRFEKHDPVIMVLSIIQAYIVLGLIIAIFVAVPSWPCHDQWSIVILGGKLSSTGRGRTLWIAGTTIVLSVYTATLCHGYASLFMSFMKRGETNSSSAPHSAKEVQPAASARRHKRRKLDIGGLNIDGKMLFGMLAILIVSALAIANMELLRVRNGIHDTNTDWGFGQILAIALVLLPAVRTSAIFWKLGLKRAPMKSQSRSRLINMPPQTL
jgi:hypothetical protein